MAMAPSLEETGTYEPHFCSALLAKEVIRLQEIGLHWLSLIKTVKRDWQARQTLVSWAQQETSYAAKPLTWFQVLIAKSELAFDSSPSSEQLMAWVLQGDGRLLIALSQCCLAKLRCPCVSKEGVSQNGNLLCPALNGSYIQVNPRVLFCQFSRP